MDKYFPKWTGEIFLDVILVCGYPCACSSESVWGRTLSGWACSHSNHDLLSFSSKPSVFFPFIFQIWVMSVNSGKCFQFRIMFINGLNVISILYSLLPFFLQFNSMGLVLITVLQYCLAYLRFNRKQVLLSSQGTFSIFFIEPWFSCCFYSRYSYFETYRICTSLGRLLMLTICEIDISQRSF